jgi:CBS domain-containing protein
MVGDRSGREEEARMRVSDIVRREVPSVREHTVLSHAADALVASGLGVLPVLDAGGLLVGVVSEGDVLRFEAGRRSDPTPSARSGPVAYRPDALVADVMSRHPVTATERQSVEEIAGLFVRLPWRMLPVVRLGRLVGVVTRTDVVRVLVCHAEPPVPLAGSRR